MKNLLFVFLLFFFHTITFSQEGNLDSLYNLLKTDKEDTTKLIHLYNINDEYQISGNYSDALKYGSQALVFADKLLKTSNSKAVINTIKLYKAKIFTNLGLIYFDQGNYSEALKNYLAGLRISEELDYKRGVAISYNNIGNVYTIQKNFPEALKNHFKFLKMAEAEKDDWMIAYAYSNIGIIYDEQNKFEEALKIYFKALKIRQELNDSLDIAVTYDNIGLVYSHLGNNEEALKNHFEALKIEKAINDTEGITISYGNIGNAFIMLKKYKEAKEYLTKAKEFSLGSGNKYVLMKIFESYTILDSATGNYKGAYENHKLFILYRDSLDNEETRKKTIQSQMTYDFEKKEAVAKAEHKKELENQNELAEEKSRKQKLIIVFVIVGLLLVMIFAGFVFRTLRITRKQKDIIEEQKNIVEEQKRTVELQKSIVEEHQKEIIDSITYARRIQRALLPSEKQIEKTLERLKKG